MSINQVSKPKKKKERAFGSPENLKDMLALGLACMHICKCHQKSTPFHLSGVLVFVLLCLPFWLHSETDFLYVYQQPTQIFTPVD